MKIDPDSESGKHLLGKPHAAHGPHEWGADITDLEKVRFFRFSLQLGRAITLPIPFAGPVVLVKSKFLDFDGHDLKDTHSLWLLRHELCHVAQIRRLGTLKYLLKHLWARVRTLSIKAESTDIEAECYEVQHRFREETFR